MKDKSIIYKKHVQQLIKKNIYYFNILRKNILKF